MGKKLLNHPQDAVAEMLEGMAKANDDIIRKVDGYKVLVRQQKKDNKVSLVSGGGSGHEPAHGGYVGHGMLDAAVAGPIFTSPNPEEVLQAIREVQTKKGVLVIIKNYSGDVMNFKMACEKAKDEGIKCDFVVVNDDVAIEDPENRRGISGTIFVHKIAGAAAELGHNLKEVKKIANKTIDLVHSKGVALSPCYIPGSNEPSFEIGEEEMEVGLGIHGEPGVEIQNLKNSEEVSGMLLEDILNVADYEGGRELAVMVNSLGATTLMELNVVVNDLYDLMKKQNLPVFEFYTGLFMTSMEMKGVSISLLGLDQQLKDFLTTPVDVVANFG